MKKIILLLTGLLLCASWSYAQERMTMKVTSGEDINQLLATSRFLFPEFQDANVYFKKSTSRAKMNYNMLSGEMLFIDPNGDTLALKNVSEVLAIAFGKRLFKNSPKDFVEVLATNSTDDSELVIRRRIRKGDERKEGAYGITSSVASISSVSNVYTESGSQALSISSEVSFKKEITYYLVQKNKYRTADCSGFLKAYPKKKADIENYLKQTPVDFDNEADVLRLFRYCGGEE